MLSFEWPYLKPKKIFLEQTISVWKGPKWIISTSFSTSPPQEAVHSKEVTPQPPSVQTGQAQTSQMLLTQYSFQPFQQFC